jgi:hypothetical protein
LPGLTVKADTLASCDRPKIGGALHVVIKAPGSNLPTQSDQLSRDVVVFRQRAQRLTGDEFISHLRFERDAITTMPGHGLYSQKARRWGANLD